MRRMLMLAASAAVMLTSCSNDKEIGDVEGDKNGSEINFRTLIDKGAASRATVTNSENILGFTVSGWWDKTTDGTTTELGDTNTGGYLFNAFDLTRREAGVTDWEYDPKIYWPSSGKGVLFYAYSPASSKNVTSGKGLYNYKGDAIEYTVPDPGEAEAQEDFLLARTGNLNKETVKLNFAHALSRATFSAKKTNENITYLIKSVTLVNIKKRGTIDIKDIPTTGAFDYTAIKVLWVPTSEQPTDTDIKVDLGNSPVFVEYNEYKSILGPTNALMVLPQATNAWDAKEETGFAVKVEYKAYIDVADPGTYYAGTPSSYKTVHFPVEDHVFEIGRQYNFALTFGAAEAGGKIGFDVQVGDWSDAPVVEVPQITNYWPDHISEALAAAVKADYATAGVTLGDIMKVKKIFLKDISEGEKIFTGIEYFGNMETIILNNVQGVVLDVSKLDKLTYVNIGLNVKFKELNISGRRKEQLLTLWAEYRNIININGVTEGSSEKANNIEIETFIVWDGFQSSSAADAALHLGGSSGGNGNDGTFTVKEIIQANGEKSSVEIKKVRGQHYE
ncbi:fimbrillin family protein [Parabacteroides sp. OttesenSCG-928-O15]|nr:fimbrillin family protein [Parabacteroides sp. OttesenSCG-928-O15]